MINRGARRLADCSGQMIWPKRSVYLIQPEANVACYFYDPDYINVEFGARWTQSRISARYGDSKGSTRA